MSRPDLAGVVARYAALLVPGWKVTSEWRTADAMPKAGAIATCSALPTRELAHVCAVDPFPPHESLDESVAHEMVHACLSPLTALLEATPASVMLEEQAVERLGKAIAAASPRVAQAMARAVAAFAPRVAARLPAPRGRINAGGRMDPKMVSAALDALVAGDSAKALEILKQLIASAAGGEAHAEPDGDEGKAPPAPEAPARDAAPPQGGEKPATPYGEKKPEPAARLATDAEVTLAARVQALEAERAQEREQLEREKLLATRPDFTPEVRGVLARSSLETVRDFVNKVPRSGATRARLTGETTQAPTRGDAQGEPSTAPRVPADEAAKIDRVLGIMPVSARMGYGEPDPMTGGRRLHTMTPAQARAQGAADAQKGAR